MAVCSLLLLFSFSNLSAQESGQSRQAFIDLVDRTEAQLDLKTKSTDFLNHFEKESPEGTMSEDEVFTFSLNNINVFMADSEMFKFEDDKLILPFRSMALVTIPQWVNSGGVNFEVFLGAKTKGKSVLKYLISAAAETFAIDQENVELRFFWFDQKGKRLIGGPNTMSVKLEAGKLSAEVVATTEATDGVASQTALGDVEKFYKKGNWQAKLASIDRDQ